MKRQASSESRSLGSRVRKAAKRVTEPLASATDAVTGRGVEQRVAEYSETFTQVVLGLHEDMAAATRRIGDLEAAVGEVNKRISHGDLDKRYKMGPYIVAIGALAVALVALGFTAWIAL